MKINVKDEKQTAHQIRLIAVILGLGVFLYTMNQNTLFSWLELGKAILFGLGMFVSIIFVFFLVIQGNNPVEQVNKSGNKK